VATGVVMIICPFATAWEIHDRVSAAAGGMFPHEEHNEAIITACRANGESAFAYNFTRGSADLPALAASY